MKRRICNLLTILLGIFITAISVKFAYYERGYMAFGSEWFTFPILMILHSLYREIKGDEETWM